MQLIRLSLLFVFLMIPAAHAQTIRAAIYGTVVDPSGSGIPGATVRAIHVPTNTELTFTADQQGSYDFPRLVKFGEYRLEAEATGFQKLIREGLNIGIDQRVRVDLELRVGDVNQSVQVSAETPLLETSNSTPGQ